MKRRRLVDRELTLLLHYLTPPGRLLDVFLLGYTQRLAFSVTNAGIVHRVSLYADDLLLYVSNAVSSFPIVFTILDKYRSVLDLNSITKKVRTHQTELYRFSRFLCVQIGFYLYANKIVSSYTRLGPLAKFIEHNIHTGITFWGPDSFSV